MADIPPFEVPYEYAKEPINNQAIYFPEFENYQIFVGRYKPEKKDPGLIDAFRYVGSGLGSMANYLGDKYQEYDMNNKIIDGGAATLKGLGIAGKSLYKIAKPVAKYATIRTVQGVGYLCDQIKNLLMVSLSNSARGITSASTRMGSFCSFSVKVSLSSIGL